MTQPFTYDECSFLSLPAYLQRLVKNKIRSNNKHLIDLVLKCPVKRIKQSEVILIDVEKFLCKLDNSTFNTKTPEYIYLLVMLEPYKDNCVSPDYLINQADQFLKQLGNQF